MKWNALYVNSRAEKKVGELLNDKNIEAYVPLVKTMRQWSDRKKMVEIPLINGYVFVKSEPQKHEKILQTKGVVAFVKSEGKVADIRDLEIERLKQLVNLGYQMESLSINRQYRIGDKVKITSGSLKGLEGFVHHHREDRFMEILLESIGQCIRVKLPKDIIVPV